MAWDLRRFGKEKGWAHSAWLWMVVHGKILYRWSLGQHVTDPQFQNVIRKSVTSLFKILVWVHGKKKSVSIDKIFMNISSTDSCCLIWKQVNGLGIWASTKSRPVRNCVSRPLLLGSSDSDEHRQTSVSFWNSRQPQFLLRVSVSPKDSARSQLYFQVDKIPNSLDPPLLSGQEPTPLDVHKLHCRRRRPHCY